MYAIIQSRRWYFRALRIGLFAGLGWWLLDASGLVYAERPRSWEWPRTDFTRTVVDLDEIRSGGPPKDGIPAIDAPRFVDAKRVGEWLGPREPVIALSLGDTARAYPLQVLIYHEIVNDTVDGRPVSVTFCPLCNAAIAFDRRLDGRVLDFGTTGRLRNSDMVMYDRQTESWWQQFTGRGLVGAYAGRTLLRLPVQIVAFEDFRTAYPAGEVLSRETGYSRPYGRNPYRGYDRVGERPFLHDGPGDPRLPAMERVLGVRVGAARRLYPLTALRRRAVVNDELAGTPVVVLRRSGMHSALDTERIAEGRLVPAAAAFDRRVDGRLLRFTARDGALVDRETGSRWDHFGRARAGPLAGRRLTPLAGGVHFAFAWLAFHPEAEVYRPGAE